MAPNGERQRAEQGLREALDRLDSRINDQATGDPLISLAEALNWAYSLEDWHRKKLKAAGIGDYRIRRDNGPDGGVTAGVIYARNLVAHQLTEVGALVDVYTGDLYHSDIYQGAWRWRPFSQLPKPEPGHEEKQGRDQKYIDHVQEEPLLDRMRDVERFLTTTVKLYYP
jgi:hypothetical protein